MSTNVFLLFSQSKNVLYSILVAIVILSVRPSLWHTGDPLLNSSISISSNVV